MKRMTREESIWKSPIFWRNSIFAAIVVPALMTALVQSFAGVSAMTVTPDESSQVFDVGSSTSDVSTYIGTISPTKLELFVGNSISSALSDRGETVASINATLSQPDSILPPSSTEPPASSGTSTTARKSGDKDFNGSRCDTGYYLKRDSAGYFCRKLPICPDGQGLIPDGYDYKCSVCPKGQVAYELPGTGGVIMCEDESVVASKTPNIDKATRIVPVIRNVCFGRMNVYPQTSIVCRYHSAISTTNHRRDGMTACQELAKSR
jgi:hypothetical protein